MNEHIEGVGEVPRPFVPGTLLVVRGNLGVPYIVRVEAAGMWVCIYGIFKGRHIQSNKQVLHVCEDGDTFDDIGLVVRGGELVPMGYEDIRV